MKTTQIKFVEPEEGIDNIQINLITRLEAIGGEATVKELAAISEFEPTVIEKELDKLINTRIISKAKSGEDAVYKMAVSIDELRKIPWLRDSYIASYKSVKREEDIPPLIESVRAEVLEVLRGKSPNSSANS